MAPTVPDVTLESVPERHVAFHLGHVRFSEEDHERFFDDWERRIASYLAGYGLMPEFFARVYHSDTGLEVWPRQPDPSPQWVKSRCGA